MSWLRNVRRIATSAVKGTIKGTVDFVRNPVKAIKDNPANILRVLPGVGNNIPGLNASGAQGTSLTTGGGSSAGPSTSVMSAGTNQVAAAAMIGGASKMLGKSGDVDAGTGSGPEAAGMGGFSWPSFDFPGFGNFPGMPDLPDSPDLPTYGDASENAKLLLRDDKFGRNKTILSSNGNLPAPGQRRGLLGTMGKVTQEDILKQTLGIKPINPSLGVK